MNKKQTMAYIKALTGVDADTLMFALLIDKGDHLKNIEYALHNKDVYRYVWNNLYFPRENRVMDYDEFSDYPKLCELLKKRLEAYWKYADREYAHKEFSSERLKFIPFLDITDNELGEKLHYDDWKSFYKEDLVERNPYKSLHNKLNHFCVVEKNTENRVGIVAINTDIPTDKDWNIGYMIAKVYRKRGYAQESVKAVIEAVKNKHIFGIKNTLFEDVYKINTNCKNLVGVVRDENVDSQKVLERCGFHKTTEFKRDGFVTYIFNLT